MKRIPLIAAFLALALCSGPALAMDKLVVGIGPWHKPQDIQDMYADIVAHLKQKLNMDVTLVITRDYDDLVDRAQKKTVDVSRLEPAQYVTAKESFPELVYLVTALNRDGQGGVRDYYKGLIIAKKGSGVTTVADLKGKKFAFTDTGSTSGYVYPRVLLRKLGLDPDKDFGEVFMLKKHDKVADAVVSGAVDAGATYDEMLWVKKAEHGDVYTIVAETAPIPYGVFAAGPHIPADLRENIKQALKDYNVPKEKWDSIHSQAPVGFSVRDDAFYDAVREAGKAK